MAEDSSQRDLRIDFFKGVALLIVVVDHIEGWAGRSVIEAWTLINLGFSDAAEIFHFLSGYVLAIAYSRALEAGGFRACLRKSLKRCLQIYVAYVLAAVTIILIGAWLIEHHPPNYVDDFLVGHLPLESILAALSLRYHPWGYDILALYVPILPLMALLLYLRRHAAWLAWIISGGAYLTAVFYPDVNLHRFGDNDFWYFNPLAWQFLFFLGICAGDPQTKLREPRPRWLFVSLSLAVIAFGVFLLKISPYLTAWRPELRESFEPIYVWYRWWAGKTSLRPLRLVHFFALVYLVTLLMPHDRALRASRWARPLIVAGQNSLEVYAFGLVISFLAVFAFQHTSQSAAMLIALDVLACLLSLGFGLVVKLWYDARKILAQRDAQSVRPQLLGCAADGPSSAISQQLEPPAPGGPGAENSRSPVEPPAVG